MIDITTWEKLTLEEQEEFQKLEEFFIKSVLASRAQDGNDFATIYRVEKQGNNYVITDGDEILGDIHHSSEKVIRTLFMEAVQNYGR